jgi:hypothetical protein
MLRRAEVFRCMPVFRSVTTADVAAGSAEAKMHPCVAGGEALFAACGIRGIRHDEIEMAARGCHDGIGRNSFMLGMKAISLSRICVLPP